MEPVPVAFSACEGGVGQWRLLDSDGVEVVAGDLAEGVPGEYSGTIDYVPHYEPGRSIDEVYTLVSEVACGEFEQALEQTIEYIDPEGVVVDCVGTLVAGATVTLYRSEAATGPFVAVADGDTSVMDPAVNTANPSTTGTDGRFQWFTTAGFYQVEAAYAGSVARTGILPVPPEQLGLRLVFDDLNCPESTVERVSYPGSLFVPTPTVVPGPVPAAASTAVDAVPPVGLAHTGTESQLGMMLALMLLGSGFFASGMSRRRRRAR